MSDRSDLISALASAAQSPLGITFVSAREDETKLTFSELLSHARRIAGALRARGIREGDRVALVLPTCPGFVESFFGILCAGAVPVPLYPPVRLGRMDEYHRATTRMLQLSGARLVITDAKIRLLLGQALADARPDLGSETVSALLSDAAPELELRPSPDALGLVQFSSGSTVDPKPVALSHFNLVAQCTTLKQALPEPVPGEGVGVSWLPLYHDMGLIGCLLMAVSYPGRLVLLPPEAFLARPALWLRTISKHRGTHSPAPNFAYGVCLKRVKDEELEGVDLSSWTYAMNGAEPISVEIARRFAERFSAFGFNPASLMPVYGLSEASLAVTFSPRRAPLREAKVDAAKLAARGEVHDGARSIASVGVPVPGVEVEVRDELGAVLGEGRVGRIHVRGPSVMVGYLGSEEATARALAGGWLDTGDLGFWKGGELHVCGRAKDLVIVRGANHAPQEFEDCVNALPGIRTGCVVALGFVPDESGSEELLVLAESTEADDAALKERLRTAIVERTGIRPHTVELLAPGTLPRTSSGKLRRRETLRRFLAGELRPPKPVTPVTVAMEMAKSTAALLRSKVSS